MDDKEHPDEPSGGGRNSLFAKCSLTLSKEIFSRKDDDLLTAITTQLKFKITGFADLTIEKENVTERDMSRLTKLLKSKLEPRLGDDYVMVNSENDEMNHRLPESDGAEKPYQAVKKEDPESLGSFEQISGPNDVTEESQSPEKTRNAGKGDVAPQPTDSQDEMDSLNNMFMRSLSLSESQTGDSSSRSTSQIMTGMDHQVLPVNLEPTSSEEKREYVSAPCQCMPSSQPVVSQPTGAAGITSKKSDRPKGMMLRPPVDGKRDKQSKSDYQQKAENRSSTDTQGVRGIKDKDHEGNIGQMSSQEKETPDGNIPQLSRQEDSNGGSGAENEGNEEDGQRNKNNTAVLKEETAKNSKMQASTTCSKKTKTSEKKSLGEGHGEAMDTSDVSDVDSLGSDTGDKGKCATSYNGNKVKQSDGGKRGNPNQVSAGQELEEGIGQVQGQSSITNQCDKMEHNRESDLSQMTHEPESSQDMTDDVGMTPNNTLGTRTKTRQRHTEVAPNQGNGFQGRPDSRNAEEDYAYNSHNADQQMKKSVDLNKVEIFTSESDNDESYEDKGEIQYDTQDKPSESSERPGEPRRVPSQRGHKQVKHHSDDEHMMDTGGEQPLEPTALDNQTNVNKSMPDEESYEEQDRKSEDMNQIRESEGQSGSVSDKDDEHKKDNSLFSQSTSERQRSIKECGQPEKQRGNAKGKHQTGSAGKQSEDSTDGGDINTESAQSRQDNEATIDQKQLEKQWRNTRNVDSAEMKGTIDNNTDGSDITERDETESKCNRQAEITVSNEQSCDGSEKQLSLTGNVHPGGKTKGQRGYDAGENDKHSVPVSTCEDSGCDSQSRKNKVYREEKEGSQPVRRRQQGGDGTDKDNEYKKKVSSQSHSRADDETRIREHMARKEQRKMTGSMQNDGRSERHDGQESDKDKYMYNSGMSHSVSGHRGIDQKEGDVYPNDDDDNEASGSDSQFGARDDISKSSSSENSTRQDDENPSMTSDEDTDISNSKNRHAEMRSRVEKASQEDRTAHSCHAVTGGIQKGQAMNLAKSRSPETTAQKAYMESLEGRDSSDKMEKQIDSDGEKQTDDVDSPPEFNKAKGQRMQKKDKDKVERDSMRKENYDNVNSEKLKVKDELNDDERMKSKRMETPEKDISNADQLDTESDDEDPSIEYVMKKVNFKLARMYYDKRPEHRYFEKAKKIDEGYLMIFRNKDSNGIRFLKSLKRLKIETIVHAENDRPKVRPIVDQLKCKDLDVELIDHGSKSFLVGPKEKVAEVKQKIILKMQETDENGKDMDIHQKPQRQRSQLDMRDDTDSSSRFSDGGARPKNSEGVKISKEKDPYESTKDGSDYTRRSLYQGDSMERCSREADPGVYTGRYSDIKVHVHNTDITKLRVDCIVNAANTRLKHGGGVARVIATAAGKELQEACESFIDAGNTVPVTYLFVSPGGRLPAKHVLHAVGPKWDLYTDKEKCTDDLRRTVLRCLVEAMRLRLSSIALPSISAAIFRVPKEHCARSYMNAVKHFEEIRKDMDHRDCTLKEIHFVDVDDIMVNYIRECFMKHWREPSDPDARQADEKVFQEQLKSAKSQPPRNQISGPSQRSLRPSSPGDKPTRPRDVPSSSVAGATAKSVEKDTVYQLGELQLCISSRSALSVRSDLVITVGEEFDKLSGLPDYNVKSHKKPCDDVPKKKNCYTFSWIHKPNGKYGQLLCRLFPDPKSPEVLSSAFENLDAAIRLAAVRGDKVKDVKSFVLTSNILYAEPSNKKNKTPSLIDKKLAGNFGRQVFDYVEKLSKESSCKVKQVFVTASEDVSVGLCKILETRPSIKKIDTSAPGAYPHPRQRGKSPARRVTGSRGGSTSSHNSGWTSNSHGQQHGTGHFESEHSSRGGMSGDRGAAYHNPGPRGPSPAMSGQGFRGSSSPFSSNSWQTDHGQQNNSGPGSSVDPRGGCPICRDDSNRGVPVSCCGGPVCDACQQKLDRCPFCKKFWRIRTGNQPDGRMCVYTINDSCDGYEHSKTWQIDYKFPLGYQKSNHPNPGQVYYTTTRTAFLPATSDGLPVLKMLKLAFARRLTFTIGHSRTRNKDDVITWNDIHHKTSCHSGTHGYPDPNYLTNVTFELLNNGVTLDSMTEEEEKIVSKFEFDIRNYGCYYGY